MENKETLKKNEVYIQRGEKLHRVDKPKEGFGKTIIHWQNGKPIRIETNYTEEIK